MSRAAAIAIAAHPDDIEYMMAGTLLLLKQAGWETHYFNLSSGNCGSLEMDPEETARVRLAEARRAAEILGSQFHPPLTKDLEILYGPLLVRKVSAVIREVGPSIVLTHSPQDYMEDHMETCRIAVSAAFTHSVPNWICDPPRKPHSDQGNLTVYHALPHGLHDGLRQRIAAGAYVDTSSVQETKLAALAAHRSQQAWLSASQGMNSYLQAMMDTAQEVGRLSGAFAYAEGWRRHSHLGYSTQPADPLREVLAGKWLENSDYEAALTQPR